jgi:ATP-binding protein involved in chromosome partitioning
MGKKVGILDVDIHGPSIPLMFGINDASLRAEGDEILPAIVQGIKIMSIGFLLQNSNDPVIWRGPMKMNIIKQFLGNVRWGDIDYLIIDCPPGTGDEPLSICQLINNLGEAIVVTTPQNVALNDVRKSINFCNKLNLPILGVVENMSGFKCPYCGEISNIFSRGGAEKMAKEMHVPFLGKIPIEQEIMISGDSGKPFMNCVSPVTGKIFMSIVENIIKNKGE